MRGGVERDEERTSSHWSVWLWTAFWTVWALRGLSLLIDLGAAQRPLAVASWIAFGAVLTELTVRQLQAQNVR